VLLHIKQVLTPDQAAEARARVERAQWIDGNVTSGHQSAQAKYNEQLPEDSPVARELGGTILAALERSALFMSAALPKQVFPPLFNRYAGGMAFGNHVDNAIRVHAASRTRLRTDLSATLFLTPPDEYEGGELLVEDTYGVHSSKLPAGDLILYPATSLHRVTPVTRGARISSFFWIQSMVADDGRRTLLFDLDMAIVRLTRDAPGHPSLVSLTACYHNLLRMWVEL
jgi:PKHD-type hydroxylase